MLTFRTVDPERDRELSQGFERDAFMASFGHLDHMTESELFIVAWLEGLIEKDPASCVYACLGDEVVGELRMTIQNHGRDGYLFFIYVTPEHRGTFVSSALHDYALNFFRKHGVANARLSVSPTNARANAFYDKHGWVDLGPRSDAPHVNLRQLALTSS